MKGLELRAALCCLVLGGLGARVSPRRALGAGRAPAPVHLVAPGAPVMAMVPLCPENLVVRVLGSGPVQPVLPPTPTPTNSPGA
jgi:hypothetical protein